LPTAGLNPALRGTGLLPSVLLPAGLSSTAGLTLDSAEPLRDLGLGLGLLSGRLLRASPSLLGLSLSLPGLCLSLLGLSLSLPGLCLSLPGLSLSGVWLSGL
jgi:hypothetical protein